MSLPGDGLRALLSCRSRKDLSHWAYRAKWHFWNRALPISVPVDVSLELASLCNMSCSYCYHSEKDVPWKKGFMPVGMAREILLQSAQLRVPAVKFNWRGESTAHPKFLEILSYARALSDDYPGALIDRLTNSNFKFRTDREDIFRALCQQTKVKVSYDSFRKEVFETQRAGGDHALTTANIDKFYNYPMRARTGTRLSIQAVRTQLNADEDIRAETARRWPGAEVSIRDVVGGRLLSGTGIDHLEVRKRDISSRQACTQAFVRLVFTAEGKASPCCPSISDELFVGDIAKQTVREIFNSEIARQLRKDLRSKKAFEKDPCLNCSSHESYSTFKPRWSA